MVVKLDKSRGSSSRALGGSVELVASYNTNELFFGIVGPIGAGASKIGGLLADALRTAGYAVTVLKAREVILAWAERNQRPPPREPERTLARVRELQDLGDAMREEDHAAVAAALVGVVRESRARAVGKAAEAGKPVEPDGKPRAFIFDSLKHPAEIQLFRRIYQNAFILVGVVCLDDVRVRRLSEKYDDGGNKNAIKAIERDSDDRAKPHGQHVGDTFFEADFFVDNSADEKKEADTWSVPDHVGRLVDLLARPDKVHRPQTSEVAMHHAFSASRASACLSRQVGAALVDADGNLLAVGTNEVPRAGGGLYGEGFGSTDPDHRCAYDQKYCSSTRQRNEIIEELTAAFPALAGKEREIARTRIGQLVEFSRAVHAEMDAIVSAARKGASPIGTRLFVTTFPCHYCARHIVAAGIDEVQYVEPYPKSRALDLHPDSITTSSVNWHPPSEVTDGSGRVLFRPFVGVAPRIYSRVFGRKSQLKDPVTGDFKVALPVAGDEHSAKRVSYAQLEADLVGAGGTA